MSVKRINEVLREMTATYNDAVKASVRDSLDQVIKSATTAKGKLDSPAMIAMHIADIVQKCTVALIFIYKSHPGAKKIARVTGKLDELPAMITGAAGHGRKLS